MLSNSDVDAIAFVPPPIAKSLFKYLNRPVDIVYSSAIAHQLAASVHQPAPMLAVQIAAAWTGCLDHPAYWQALPIPAAVLPDLSIRATSAGLVQITLEDRAIAGWLEQLIQPTAVTGEKLSGTTLPSIGSPPQAFVGQHAHARCCSLLRLADREGLITLNLLDLHPNDWQFVNPNPIPWLTSAGQLRVQDAVDRRLICQLFAIWDELARSSPLSTQVILRRVKDVAQAFQIFHRAHPIFGRTVPVEVTQTQLALMLATQRILFQLLEDELQVCAPVEL